jgi:hypothetical protein
MYMCQDIMVTQPQNTCFLYYNDYIISGTLVSVILGDICIISRNQSIAHYNLKTIMKKFPQIEKKRSSFTSSLKQLKIN